MRIVSKTSVLGVVYNIPMTTSPLFVVQLEGEVHDCQVIAGWVSVFCVPTPWPLTLAASRLLAKATLLIILVEMLIQYFFRCVGADR